MAPVPVLYLSTSDRVGGAEESLLTLLGALDRGRFAPLLACPDEPGEGAPGRSLAARAGALGVETLRLPLLRLKRTANPVRLLSTARSLARGRAAVADLVRARNLRLIHANAPMAGLYAAGAPLVCHVRDLRLPRLAARALRRRVWVAVATSGAVARLARARLGDCVRRIPNGVDAERFRPGRCPRAGAPYVLMIGHVVPWKRHDLFLQALARIRAEDAAVRGVILGADLFGEHADECRRLEARARAWGLHHALEWRTADTPAEVADLLAGASALIHPAPAQPFGRAVLEAMACATPVIAFDAAGPRELLSEGGGALVPFADVGRMARTALSWVHDPAEARRHGAEGRAAVLAHYTAERHARAVEALYDAVAPAG